MCIRDSAEGAFLPSPGPITTLSAPDGFGTRFDTGYSSGDEISQFYDNLVGKLCVWGHDRPTAIRRALRALDELVIEGVATTVPADIAILESEAFQANTHSTNWVENELDLSGVRYQGSAPTVDGSDEPLVERTVPAEVNGRRFEVKVWVPEGAATTAAPRKKRSAAGSGGASSGGGSGVIEAPMQGTIVGVQVEAGDSVSAGDTIVVLEAMKMENAITADIVGTVAEIAVAQGDSVGSGDLLARITP